MPTMKRYTAPMPVPLPRSWVALLSAHGETLHHSQGDVLAIGSSKTDVSRTMLASGLSAYDVDTFPRYLRVRTGTLPTSWQMLADAGVVDLREPAVYFARDLVRGSVVARTFDGGAAAIARLGYDTARGVHVAETLSVDGLDDETGPEEGCPDCGLDTVEARDDEVNRCTACGWVSA